MNAEEDPLVGENAPRPPARKNSRYIVIAAIFGLVILGSVCVFASRLVIRGGLMALPLVKDLFPSPTPASGLAIPSPPAPPVTATHLAAPTQKPTATQAVTPTQLPTSTPLSYPVSDSSPRTIEGARILLDGGSFSFPVIAVSGVQSLDRIGTQTARAGLIFAIVHVSITNPDPVNIATYGRSDFLAIGADGIIISPTGAGLDCALGENRKVVQGATLFTCLIFEVQPASTFTFLFAPYQYSQLSPSTSLGWEIVLK
jgi:hypothetical protein